jgi:drug/metabolite transporter (DMT)-like permease
LRGGLRTGGAAVKWILVAIVAAGTTLGDLLQSKAMKGHGEVHDFRPHAVLRTLLRVVRDPRIIGAVLGYTVAFAAFIKLLSISDVSFAVPATASSYVVETILGKYLLKERVTWQRWAGALLVAFGVALLSL